MDTYVELNEDGSVGSTCQSDRPVKKTGIIKLKGRQDVTDMAYDRTKKEFFHFERDIKGRRVLDNKKVKEDLTRERRKF